MKGNPLGVSASIAKIASMLTNLLDFAALLIQIIGTLIMFLNAPKNIP
jgi:hypothetical protein